MTTKGKKSVIETLYAGMVEDPSIEYPDSDGEPMAEDEEQLYMMIDTISALREWYADQDDVHVGGDLLIYYRMNDNETRVAPDVFVVFGSDKNRRRNWMVWREGKAPDFVMEVASGSTWRRDMREKRDIYAEMEVTEYWRFDPSGTYFAPPLIGERLVDGQYRQTPLETDGDGVLRGHSEALGLDICALPDGNLRLYDPESGQWLQTHQEDRAERLMAQAALQEAEAARQAAETARQEAEAARQAVEDENRRLREQLQALQSGQ